MVRTLRFVGVVAILTLAVLASASCGGGNGITSPSGTGNLNSAPPGAFEISDGRITVRYWFEITPGPGPLGPGDKATITIRCRASSGESYLLRITPTTVRPDGTKVPGYFGTVNWGVLTDTTCLPETTKADSTTLGTGKFEGISELQLAAVMGPNGSSPTANATAVQPVGWIPK